MEHTFQIDALNCSALPKFFFLVLWLLLTSCRSLLLRISPSARPRGINQFSFLVYLLGLRNRVTVTFWTSLLLVNLSAYFAFVPSFCSSGYDFAIPSSRLHLAMQTLGVAFGLVGNYLPADFHRRALICPSYQKTHFCLPTKVRFLNDVCLRQMMLASPMMTATPNDVCLTAHWANIASLRNAVEQHHFERSEKHHIAVRRCIIEDIQGLRLDLFTIV